MGKKQGGGNPLWKGMLRRMPDVRQRKENVTTKKTTHPKKKKKRKRKTKKQEKQK